MLTVRPGTSGGAEQVLGLLDAAVVRGGQNARAASAGLGLQGAF